MQTQTDKEERLDAETQTREEKTNDEEAQTIMINNLNISCQTESFKQSYMCEFVAKTVKEINEHIVNIHEDNQELKCNYCKVIPCAF